MATDWQQDGNTVTAGGEDVCICVSDTHAELIVRAVNSHDQLVGACEAGRAALLAGDGHSARIALDFIEAALTKAKGATE